MSRKPSRSIVVGPVFTCLILALFTSAFAQPSAPGRPRLGVKLEPAADDEGIVITEVMYGYAAETAGLRGGDVVVRVGDQEITGVEAFRKAVGSIGDGATVPFVVVRDGQEQTTTLELDSDAESSTS